MSPCNTVGFSPNSILCALMSMIAVVGSTSCAPSPKSDSVSASVATASIEHPASPAAITVANPAAEPGVVGARQITFSERFIKAGESYFSPDAKHIVFQAIERPTDGTDPDEFYAMYVCDVVRETGGPSGGLSGEITGVENMRRVSPKGSANTCGWFHPTKPNTLIFASTIGPPTMENAPGYQRGTSRYRWAFPRETRIVEVDLEHADCSPASLKVLEGDGKAYVAEGSISRDGRHLLFCSLETGDGDLYIRDLKTGKRTCIVGVPGYDGGPFFSPDAKRICYRSDRNKDNLLQVFIADLVFDKDGSITGIANEQQLTSNEHVNWCPFFRPDGKTLVYGTSEIGHRNYEIFELVIPADMTTAPVRRRVTEAEGADVLPAFSPDGKWLLWTGQRNEGKVSQLFVGHYRDQS